MKHEENQGNQTAIPRDIVNIPEGAGMNMNFFEKFPTEKAAIEYFLEIRCNGVLTCPHCGSIDYVYRNKGNLKLVQCHACNNSFSPFSGTMFEKSRTDTRAWFYAITQLGINDRKGISALQLQRDIHMYLGEKPGYRTVWRMLHQIREAMGNVKMKKDFDCIAEIDETYIGGKPRKQNALVLPDGNLIPRKYPEKNKRGRGTKKIPAVGIKERSTGRVYIRVMPRDEDGKALTGKQLLEVIKKACKEGTVIMTDDFKGYNILDKEGSEYIRLSASHSQGEYCSHKTPGVHTNGIESIRALVKRAYIGTYHHYSKKYMQRYVDEVAFRQSNKDNPFVFDVVLEQAING
jgi:transposase-like protein